MGGMDGGDAREGEGQGWGKRERTAGAKDGIGADPAARDDAQGRHAEKRAANGVEVRQREHDGRAREAELPRADVEVAGELRRERERRDGHQAGAVPEQSTPTTGTEGDGDPERSADQRERSAGPRRRIAESSDADQRPYA